jgi:hypothetical protein
VLRLQGFFLGFWLLALIPITHIPMTDYLSSLHNPSNRSILSLCAEVTDVRSLANSLFDCYHRRSSSRSAASCSSSTRPFNQAGQGLTDVHGGSVSVVLAALTEVCSVIVLTRVTPLSILLFRESVFLQIFLHMQLYPPGDGSSQGGKGFGRPITMANKPP